MEERKCSYCKIAKPISQFYKDKGKSGGYGYRCRSCDVAQQRARYAQRRSTPEGKKKWKEITKWANIKLKYGITKRDFENFMKRQDGKCAVCRELLSKKIDIDHNHETGKVRGILCHRCNTAIGFFRESTEILSRAIEYLK